MFGDNENDLNGAQTQNVQNGANIQINIGKAPKVNKFKLWFNIFVHPIIGNKFVPADGIDDANSSDDYADNNDQQPYSENDEIEMDDDGYRHSRSICVVLYKPNMAKRHIIKLGAVDPQPLYWNRRVFIEQKNSDFGIGNYYALLYAFVETNQGRIMKKLLGFAPLLKIEHENGSTPSQQQFFEYQLSIPINENRFFQYTISSLELQIYQGTIEGPIEISDDPISCLIILGKFAVRCVNANLNQPW
uniref:Uncharacterized protein n=1 Tax=Globodera pallida TaxID=36090 RepID=A0A183CIQ5_GLOPA